MPYDASRITAKWFEAALSSGQPRIRSRAVEMLRHVDCPMRRSWLDAMSGDRDPEVLMTAVAISAALSLESGDADMELFESDFAAGVEESPLGWEWEYRVAVCVGLYIPERPVLVWTRDESDEEAKRLAVLKATVGADGQSIATPIVLGKRFVNRYTRSARSFAEAMRWRAEGRPDLRDGGC